MKNNQITNSLYLVPTPIGNLGDMTYRAVETLKSVDLIYAEDTRNSKILLKHYAIQTPMRSYHQFNEKERCAEILTHLKAGKQIALISDAGTPGISDPAQIIVQYLLQHGQQVCALPGATALIPALVASGFDTHNFTMIGFLPKSSKEQLKLFKSLPTATKPLIFYEAPHRLEKFLHLLKKYLGNADICIAREISKIHETYYRGKLDYFISNFSEIILKGEFVIIALPELKRINYDAQIINLWQNKYQDLPKSEASRRIAEELNIPKNYVYKILSEWNKN